MERNASYNKILEIIIEKSHDVRDDSLIHYYHKQIEKATGRSSQSVTRVFHNIEQPQDCEKPAIAKILKVNIDRVFPEYTTDASPPNLKETSL